VLFPFVPVPFPWSRKEYICIPRHSKDQKEMNDCDMHSVHGPEAAQIVELHPCIKTSSYSCVRNTHKSPTNSSNLEYSNRRTTRTKRMNRELI